MSREVMFAVFVPRLSLSSVFHVWHVAHIGRAPQEHRERLVGRVAAKLTVLRLWGTYLVTVCCGVVASDARTLWGRGENVFGAYTEHCYPCFVVRVRF